MPSVAGAGPGVTFAPRSWSCLDEEPAQRLPDHAGDRGAQRGAWRPSPGSIYSALALPEDEGPRPRRDRWANGDRLTDEGRAHVEDKRAELGAPWEAFSNDVTDESREVMGTMKDVAIAAAQVLQSGDKANVERHGRC